jgi:hypothetical protein
MKANEQEDDQGQQYLIPESGSPNIDESENTIEYAPHTTGILNSVSKKTLISANATHH